MNLNKTIISLLVVILALSGIFFGQKYISSHEDDEINSYNKSFEPIKNNDVSEITLQQGEQTLIIKKENDKWVSGNSLIDSTIINSLLSDLLLPSQVVLISQSSSQLSSYSLDGNTAITLMISTPNAQKKVFIGIPNSGNYYVRVDGSNDVWGLDSFVSQVSDLKLSNWLDKELVSVQEEQINTLTINESNNSFTLQQRDDNWYMDGSEDVLDKTSFSDLLRQLESIRAIGIIEDKQSKDFPAKPTLSITINSQGKTPTTIELFPGKDSIMAKISDRTGSFEIGQSVYDDLNVKKQDILNSSSK